MTIQTLQVNGTEVFIEGDGPSTIVMLHGWPDTHRLWDGMVGALAPQHRCVRFTLPGFEAPHDGPARTLGDITAQLLAIVDAASPKQPVTLLLHDWGCIFGYELAAQHPQRIARIVSIDIGDYNSSAYLQSLRGKEKLQIVGYQLWLALAWGVGRAGSVPIANRMTRWMARALRCPAPQTDIAWHMNYPYAMAWFGLGGGLRGTAQVQPQCPVFYAYGTRKPFMFQSPQWLARLEAAPGSAVHRHACGHWVMVQQADALQAQVVAYCSGAM
jgi:cis-3-alkyl-4-acyloxetan-2-one decarboxylase